MGSFLWGAKAATCETYLHVTQRLRIGGAIPPLPHMPKWPRAGQNRSGTIHSTFQVRSLFILTCENVTSRDVYVNSRPLFENQPQLLRFYTLKVAVKVTAYAANATRSTVVLSVAAVMANPSNATKLPCSLGTVKEPPCIFNGIFK